VSRTFGEAYVVRAPDPEGGLLRRRRIVQYVDLGVEELLPPRDPEDARRRPEDGQLRIVTSLRLRHDFGDYQREASGDAAELVASLDERQVDLMFAYLEAVGLGGVFDARVGRQVELSGLDFYAFDGAWARARTPANLAFEAFAGVQVDGTAVFGDPTWELDGTFDTAADRARSPMVGVAFGTWGIPWFDARIAYRRTASPVAWNRDLPRDADEPSFESGVDEELLAGTVALDLAKSRVTPYAAVRYDIPLDRWTDASVGLDAQLTERHGLRLLYLRSFPYFDLDSIFAVFAQTPADELRLALRIRSGPRWELLARTQLRLQRATTTAGSAAGAAIAPEEPVSLGAGGGASAAFRGRRFAARLDGFGAGGQGGLRWGGSVDTRTMVLWDRVGLDARLYGLRTRADTDDVGGRDGYGISLQAGASFEPFPGIHLQGLGEQLFTPSERLNARVMAIVTLDGRLRGRAR
jgi:hypothetical protein